MRSPRSLATAAFLLAGACADSADTPFDPGQAAAPEAAAAFELTVMTRNLYVGTDVDAVIAALATPDPDDDVPALVAAVATLGQTDYPARAAAVADEIARERPHAVGLQEVSTIDLTIPPLEIDVHLDFLPVLLADLVARGLHYDVAARVRNIEAAPLPGVSLIDDDALLVDRDRVAVHGTTAQRFTANVGPVAPGVVLQRGWVSAAVTIGGRDYTIASTHLESGGVAGLAQLRALQAGELAQALAGAASSVVLGDLNDGPDSPMHQVMIGAGYADVWAALRPGVAGFTCCHLPDLSDPVERFDQRIDYVFARGIEDGRLIGQVRLVGATRSDRVAGPDHPIWPSDHAGVVARLGVPESGPLP